MEPQDLVRTWKQPGAHAEFSDHPAGNIRLHTRSTVGSRISALAGVLRNDDDWTLTTTHSVTA